MLKIKVFIICAAILIAGNLIASTVLQQSGPDGGPWKFLDDGSNQGTTWIAPDFDDVNWDSGDPLFAFADDDDEVTVLEPGHITYYFRKSFEVNYLSEINDLDLYLLRDDGAVVYLNGTEIARDNMPSGDITYQTLATAEVPEGNEDTYYGFDIAPLSLLVNGTNYLAVEIHQHEATGPDVRFDLQLLVDGTWSWSSWDEGSTPPNSSSPAANWRALNYDESEVAGWDSGLPIFGFGDAGVNTSLSSGKNTYYFRRTFEEDDASEVDYLVCNILRDDGVVVYLNGTEVVRTNMPDGTVAYGTYASTAVGGSSERTYFNFGIDPTGLVDGTNCLAVEVHQCEYSSDLSFDLNLVESVVRKAPYLMFLGTNTEMQVMWQLYKTMSCNIVWGPTESYGSSAGTTEFDSDHQHKKLITGLTPGMKYYYKVTINGVEYPGTFYAAPADGTANISFLAYGDTRTFPMDHDLVIEDINTLYNTVSGEKYQTILIHSGDLVGEEGDEHNFDLEYFNPNADEIQTMLQNLPMQANRGNHEGDAAAFLKYYPYPYPDPDTNPNADPELILGDLQLFWSFDYGPVHFIMLDHYVVLDDEEADEYAFGSEQLAWLADDLANTTKTWKVIVVHHPGWTASLFEDGHSSSAAVQEHIHPLCKTHNVQLVLSGHNHYYARALVEGITYITTGGGTGALYTPLYGPGEHNIVTSSGSNHFCKFDITGSTMEAEIYNTTTNSVIETFSISDDDPLPVTLSSFEAGYSKNRVVLNWTTQSETDNFGWNIYRSETENGYENEEIIHVNSTLIEGMGTITSPTNYSFVDEHPIVEGYIYYYWLQSVSTTGELELFGPVSLEVPFSNQVPVMTTLETNYPNPFNPETYISFSIKENEKGILTIYNIRGQRVLHEKFEAGNHQYRWDAKELSSGIYFYKLSSPTLNLTKKMLLLK